MSTPHTPAPWVMDGRGVIFGRADRDEAPFVADVARTSIDPLTEQERANGLLIAAAPDLLDALRGLTRWAHLLGGWEAKVWDAARAAIAKATGEQP